MNEGRPQYQPKSEDTLDFVDYTKPPEDSVEQTVEVSSSPEIDEAPVIPAEREIPTLLTPEAHAARAAADAEQREQVLTSLAEKAKEISEAKTETPQKSEESLVKGLEQARDEKLSKLSNEIQQSKDAVVERGTNKSMEQKVARKIHMEPMANKETRKRFSLAALGTAGILETGAVAAVAFAGPLAIPLGLAGAGVFAAGGLGRLGMKAYHSYKERKHRKQYADAVGIKETEVEKVSSGW